MSTRHRSVLQWTSIAVIVLGLAADAFVHFDLASAFATNKTSTLSEADLFRAEAVAAVIAAVAVLVRPRRYTAAFAFLVAAAGTAAVIVYRYVDVGAFGPFPNMYDPYWAPAGKNISVVGEILATVAAAVLFALLHRARTDSPAADRSAAAARPGGQPSVAT